MAKNQNAKTSDGANKYRPNGWGFLLALFNKATIIPIVACIVIVVLIYNLPQNSLPDITKEALHLLHWHYVLGWVSSVILVLVCYWRSQIFNKEVDRISQEKKELQEKLIGPLGTSNKK